MLKASAFSTLETVSPTVIYHPRGESSLSFEPYPGDQVVHSSKWDYVYPLRLYKNVGYSTNIFNVLQKSNLIQIFKVHKETKEIVGMDQFSEDGKGINYFWGSGRHSLMMDYLNKVELYEDYEFRHFVLGPHSFTTRGLWIHHEKDNSKDLFIVTSPNGGYLENRVVNAQEFYDGLLKRDRNWRSETLGV